MQAATSILVGTGSIAPISRPHALQSAAVWSFICASIYVSTCLVHKHVSDFFGVGIRVAIVFSPKGEMADITNFPSSGLRLVDKNNCNMWAYNVYHQTT